MDAKEMLKNPKFIFGLLLAVVIFAFSLSDTTDYDVWYHANNGEYIWEHRGLPDTDPFLYTVEEGEREIGEWLSDIAFYLALDSGGFPLLTVGKAIVLVLIFLILFILLIKSEVPASFATVFLLVGAFTALPRWHPRPYQFTNLGVALVLWTMARRRNRKRVSLGICFVLFVFWSNLHPGHVIGLALLLYEALWETFIRKTKGLDRPISFKNTTWALLIVAFLGSCLNPGIVVQISGVTRFASSNFEFMTLMENMPPDKERIMGWFGIFLILIFISLIHMVKAGNWKNIILTLGFVGLSLRSRRFIDLLVIVTAQPVCWQLWRMVAMKPWLENKLANRKIGIVLSFILVVFGTIGLLRAPGFQFGLSYDQSLLPERAVEKASDLGLEGNWYNVFRWGGYLSYQGYPESKVFIDGRTLLYGESLIRAYYQIVQAKPGWEQLLDDYGTDLALLDDYECGGGEGPVKPRNISDAMFESPDWALLYWDDISRVYARKGRGYDDVIEEKEFYFVNPNRPMKSIGGADEATLQRIEGELRRVLADAPESVTALNLLGTIYMNRGNAARAEEFFRKAIEVPNATGGVYANLGLSLMLQNRFEEALGYFEQAIKAGTKDAALYMQISELHRHLGHEKKAEKWRREAEALAPSAYCVKSRSAPAGRWLRHSNLSADFAKSRSAPADRWLRRSSLSAYFIKIAGNRSRNGQQTV